jgi:beta-glucanase (GH16 family)
MRPLLILTVAVSCLLGTSIARQSALAQNAVPTQTAAASSHAALPQDRLDRAMLYPTFTENFTHFAASASGVVDGHPAWRTTYIGGDRTLANNHEVEWYADPGPDGPFKVVNGVLEITAAPAAGLPPGLTHRSGLIMSQRLFNQRYGYFEMRAQLPRGRGLWPAFWLLPTDGQWPPEIDVMEMLGGAPTIYYASLHARPDGKSIDEVNQEHAPDLTAGFHVFGVAWRPDRIRFYLDDRMVNDSATPADMHRSMYVLANLAVGGEKSWPGAVAPDQSGVFRIAWIRAWQYRDLGGNNSVNAKVP